MIIVLKVDLMLKICRFDIFWAKNTCDRELIDTAGLSLENGSISLSLLEFGGIWCGTSPAVLSGVKLNIVVGHSLSHNVLNNPNSTNQIDYLASVTIKIVFRCFSETRA